MVPMRKLACVAAVAALVLVVAPREARAQYSELIPDWEVGTWWEVETRPISMSMPMSPGAPQPRRAPDAVTVRFTVEEEREIDGVMCYLVKVTTEFLPEQWQVLVIRQRDFTLKELWEVYRGEGGEQRTVTRNPNKAFIYLREGILCPLDLPQFPDESRNVEVHDTLGDTDVPVVARYTFTDGGDRMRVEMVTQMNGVELRSVQVWDVASPYWIEASRTIDGADVEMGRLVRAGGPPGEQGGDGDEEDEEEGDHGDRDRPGRGRG